MLPFDINYLEDEYWVKKRSLTSICKEWGVSSSSLYFFFKKNKIKIRSKSQAVANAYEKGTRTNKEMSKETRLAISEKLVNYHKNKTPEEKQKQATNTKFNLQSKGKDWMRGFRKKAGGYANMSWRKATKVVKYIHDYFISNGYSSVLDRRPADIVINDDTAIIIDGHYRIKNYNKQKWVEKRKKDLAEYGFKKIIFCQFNHTFSKYRAQELLNKILEVGIISNEPEVIIHD